MPIIDFDGGRAPDSPAFLVPDADEGQVVSNCGRANNAGHLGTPHLFVTAQAGKRKEKDVNMYVLRVDNELQNKVLDVRTSTKDSISRFKALWRPPFT